jgi:hypothetical protein
MKRAWLWLVIACVAFGVEARGGDAGPAEAAIQDIEVTIRHSGGTVETFGKEVVLMEIIVDPTGQIHMVHMILVGGTEKDTHAWYNFDNIVSLRYRFLHITGKGKVRIRQLQGLKLAPADASLKPTITPLEVEDYK